MITGAVCVLEMEGVKLAIWCPLVYMYHTTLQEWLEESLGIIDQFIKNLNP